MLRLKKSGLFIFLLSLGLLNASRSMAFTADTLHLYFDIGQYKLTDQHQSKIKALLDSLHSAQTIAVNGFCDYLGNKGINQPLSEKRANEVKEFILAANAHFPVITKGNGQIPGTGPSSGDPYNRRVDIIFTKPKPDLKKKPDSASSDFEKRVDSLGTIEVNKSLSLQELTFEPGRHILTYGSQALLKILLKYLGDNKNIVFEIRGHICCEPSGTDGVDMDSGSRNLSVNRAREVYRYFLNNGIDKSRMTYTGVGSTQPKVYPEQTLQDQQANRRVEIFILKK